MPSALNQHSRVLLWALLAVGLLYLLQMCSPLRLNGDSVELLSIASSAADGHGFLYQGEKTRYPPGYPAMVACLDRAGLARPWSLVGLNAVFLLLALACSNYVALHHFNLNRNWRLAALLFTALSFALIKHFPLTLTDIPFFGTSMAAVALSVKAEKELGARYYAWWAATLFTSLISVLIRPTAIALFPCLVWSLSVKLGLGRFLLRNRKFMIASAGLTVILACVAAVVLLHTIYVRGALLVFAHQGLGRGIRDTVRFRLEEIGQLVLNAPVSKLGRASALIWPAAVVGIATLLTIARRCKLDAVEVYMASYLFIVLIWPYGDARFWIPVLPLLYAKLFSVAQPWNFTGWKKYIGVAYSTCYTLLGLAAFAYSTWITLSGPDFPSRYGDGNLRPTYQLFYNHAQVNNSQVDLPALEVLERYAGPPRR
jgi:hypothetical protein